MPGFIAKDNTNFREICMAGIASGRLYRSSHPLQGGSLCELIAAHARNAGIACVINLADRKKIIEACLGDIVWYKKLYDSGNVIALDMDFDFASSDFSNKLKLALQFMIAHKGPYLLHCFAGFDRTGFVSAVLEALRGATLSEIYADYMISFGTDFTSEFAGSGHKSDVLKKQLLIMDNGNELKDSTLQSVTEKYLVKTVGLTVDELVLLKKRISL